MLLTFPRAMPDALGVVGLSFTLAPMVELSPLRSGAQIAKDLGPALWRGHWASAPLHAAAAGEVRAWYHSLLSTGTFEGFDQSRTYPLAYRKTHWAGLTVGGNPFTGSGQISSVAGNNVQISLKSLPAGFLLAPGDYLAFDYAGARALHSVVVGGVADVGGLLDVEVRPHVRSGWAANAAVNFHRAAARMLILPGSFSETNENLRQWTFAFDAIQTL